MDVDADASWRLRCIAWCLVCLAGDQIVTHIQKGTHWGEQRKLTRADNRNGIEWICVRQGC